MGIQIGLLAEIGLLIFSDKVIDERDRNNERDVSSSILLQNFKGLLFLVRRKLLFKVP